MKNTKIQTTISMDMNEKICAMADYLGVSKNDFIRCAIVQYMMAVGQAQEAMNNLALKELERQYTKEQYGKEVK